jgi:hypothetical protein
VAWPDGESYRPSTDLRSTATAVSSGDATGGNWYAPSEPVEYVAPEEDESEGREPRRLSEDRLEKIGGSWTAWAGSSARAGRGLLSDAEECGDEWDGAEECSESPEVTVALDMRLAS